MRIPFEVRDINNPDELFGREQLLNTLLIDASLKQNVNIIGARRFGKTCLIRTAYSVIRSKEELGLYPIYIDFKSEDIHGTAEVYRFLTGTLIVSLHSDGLFTEPEQFGSVIIKPSDDWTEVAEQLEGLSKSKTQNLFERIVVWFSELMDKTVLLMIDEYEYLFKYALDTPNGFFKLRTLSSATNSNGFRSFCFWLTGATSWDEHISKVPGSGEANTVQDTIYVPPLDKESFMEMWEHECSLINDNETRKFLSDNKAFAYEKSGGVPFYGKDVIGAYMMKQRVLPEYYILSGFFKELTNKTGTIGEYKLLKELAMAPRKLATSNFRENLRNKGIISLKSKDIYYIPIGFLVDFIKADMNDAMEQREKLPETYYLVTQITDTIELINKQRINYSQLPVFKAVLDSASQEDDLRTPCYTLDQLSDFASAIYNIYFERSKEGRGNKLHRIFFMDHKFAKCADIARHSIGKAHEMDNFSNREGQFTRADLYVEVMGAADELSTSSEFYRFQVEMLKRFKKTLDEMFLYIKRNKV